MKKTELTIAILSLVLLILKQSEVPWTGFLLGISLFVLSSFYYFLSFALFNKISFLQIFNKSTYKNISVFNILFSIGAGWAYSIVILGVLIGLEQLPYFFTILLVGLVLATAVLIVSFINVFRNRSGFFRRILYRGIPIAIFGLVLLIIFKIQ